jgi:hypothetical protein
MTIAERLALNGLLANKQYYSAIASKPTNTDTGTVMGLDGATGRTFVVSGDGIARTNSIASSSQFAITSPFVRGAGAMLGLMMVKRYNLLMPHNLQELNRCLYF